MVRTKQSFKKECDINVIMSKYRKTGHLDPGALNQRQVVFGDVSEVGDYQECQQKIKEADHAFSTLSSEVRTRFNNDPGQLLDFCADEVNMPEAIELGIVPKPKPEPEPEPVVPPATPPTTPVEP